MDRVIVPMLRVGIHPWTLLHLVTQERHKLHSHAEYKNDSDYKYLRIINLTFYLFFFPSSALQKQLHSSLCACFCALKMKKNPAQNCQINYALVLSLAWRTSMIKRMAVITVIAIISLVTKNVQERC